MRRAYWLAWMLPLMAAALAILPATAAPSPAAPSRPDTPTLDSGGAGIYIQFDINNSPLTRVNGYPVAGGHRRYGWDEVPSTSDGVYNFSSIGRFILDEWEDGKRVGLEFGLYNGRPTREQDRENAGIQIPAWVLERHPAIKVRNTCYPSPEWYVIDYRVPELRQEYQHFIEALANYLNNTPISPENPNVKMGDNVSWVGIGLGAYGESQPVPDGGGNATDGYNSWDDAFYQGLPPVGNSTEDCRPADKHIADRPDPFNDLGMGTTEWLDEWVKPVTDLYHQAFYTATRPNLDHVELYQVSVAPVYRRAFERQTIAEYSIAPNGQPRVPPVGLKHAGLLPDHGLAVQNPPSEGSGNLSYEPLIRFAETPNVPIGWESYSYWLRDPNDPRYPDAAPDYAEILWGTLAALDKHPTMLLYERDMFDSQGEREIFFWAEKYLGVSKETTPSVWVALRETGLCSTSGCATDFRPEKGNHNFWLFQDDSVPTGQTKATTYRTRDQLKTWATGAPSNDVEVEHPGLSVFKEREGWIARRTDQGSGNPNMFFRMDSGYVASNEAVTVTVTYFDGGNDRWRLRYNDAGGADQYATNLSTGQPFVQKANSNRWATAQFRITNGVWGESKPLGASDLVIEGMGDGDEVIHMLDVARIGGSSVTPTPTATATTPTPTATATTPTPTATATTPTATATATTPTATATATTPTPTATQGPGLSFRVFLPLITRNFTP